MVCPSCGASAADGARFCAACGAAFAASAPQGSVDETVLSGGADRTRLSSSSRGTRPRTMSGSGWLSSTAEIDHGRFAPGDVVADRYRIVGLLGRGGMGEVFRADDLRLGQPVALKFLPRAVEQDPVRLAQFHNEVRTARQVSHANVCRVYDIGEAGGQHFLTMEFIDGEDLSSLIRRIGRLPEDKAIELAGQIASGLQAAHERGLLHRDLKPANIMLDREGRARITDFSLASVAGTAEDIRAGTPAYMAPEQLAGREVTVRSDIYAFGLVLYELFTGRRALDATSIAALVTQQDTGAITLPSALVTAMDPAIERVIMRCLQHDPAKRPATALAVAAALPGGDPLAAALAAGETPSPEMVAAAGSEAAALSPKLGASLLALVVVLLASTLWLSDRFVLTSIAPFGRSAEVLLDQAKAFERRLGLGANIADDAYGFGYSSSYVRWLERTGQGSDRFARLALSKPSALLFWYRSSPRALVATDGRGDVAPYDPPLLVPGMVSLALGAGGNLLNLEYVPPAADSIAEDAPAPVDWNVFFEAAGLDPSRFQPATPDWMPGSYADTRLAWTSASGAYDEAPDIPVRIDAASYRGWPVMFDVSGPWGLPVRAATSQARGRTVALMANVILGPGLILGAAFLARRNVKRGRGDRRGAARAGAAILIIHTLLWLFSAHHVADPSVEINQFFTMLAQALFQAGLFWLFYLAIEPQVRRVWPHILITWSRLVSGAFRDPLVGRDLLVGLAAGLLLTVITLLYRVVPLVAGSPQFPPWVPDMSAADGTGRFIARVLTALANALQNGALGVLGLVLLRMVLKRTSLAFVFGSLMFGFMAAQGQFESDFPLLDYAFGVLLCVVLLVVALRFGMFATMVAFFAHFVTTGIAMTADPGRVNFQNGASALVLLAAIAAVGFYFARAGEPLFGNVLAEE